MAQIGEKHLLRNPRNLWHRFMLTKSRKIASQILLRVELAASFADELLNSRLTEDLSPADRGLIQEIVLGCLRRRNQLDWLAAHFSGRAPARWEPEVRIAVRLGIYQLRFLDRIPASAAVDQSVELVKRARHPAARWAAGLVNAVLRKVTREPIESLLPPAMTPIERRAIELCHPAWLLERWSRHWGAERAEAIARLNNEPAPVFLRLPPGVSIEEGKPCRYLRHCREVDSVSGQGPAATYPVQDQASQIVPRLLGAAAGQRVLDLCAAPGMKSAALLETAPGLVLVACDIHLARLRIMRQLMRDSSAVRLPHLVALDGTRPLPFAALFDGILVDAPCSGTGTIRRHPEIKWRLEPTDLPVLAAKQRWLLNNALDYLAPGGRLLYSTCSLEPEENQQVVETTLEERRISFRLVPAETLPADFLTAEGQELLKGRYFRTLPDQGVEGFFAAIIERT
jgi:16S rRNA (cytosine967-C5)-methyltransferase